MRDNKVSTGIEGFDQLAEGGFEKDSINLVAGDTSGSSGKFVQQYTIVDFFGNTFRPSQGIINIAKGVD